MEPGITVEIVASNAPSDLRRREADIAIRNFRPSEPDLIAKKIREVPARLYASREYLDRIGRPKARADLQNAEFVSIDSSDTMMNGLNRMGLNLTEKNFPVLTENYTVMWELVKQGVGIGVLDGNIGDAEPLVERVLPADVWCRDVRFSVHAYFPRLTFLRSRPIALRQCRCRCG